MKNFNILSLRYLIPCVLLLSFLACERELNTNSYSSANEGVIYKNLRLSATSDEFITENEKLLTNLGKHSLLLSNDPVCRNAIYEGVAAKIDGDYNVLIEDLINEYSANSKKFNDLLNSNFDKYKNDLELNFFDALSPYTTEKVKHRYGLFPQIYIHNFEELKAKGSLGKEKPVVLVFNCFRKDSSYSTYTLNKNNELVSIPTVDEKFADKHEVWIISFSERILNRKSYSDFHKKAKENKAGARLASGNHDPITTNCDDSNTQLIPPPVSTGYRINLYGIQVGSHKESWIQGASEISIEIASGWGNGIPQTYPYTTYNNSGTPANNVLWRGGSLYTYNEAGNGSCDPGYSSDAYFIEIPRSKIGHDADDYISNINYEVTRDCRSSTQWGQLNDIRKGDCMYYTIFEFDNGSGEYTQSVTSSPVINPTPLNTNTVLLHVDSADPPYVSGYFYFYTSSPCFFYVINNDIRVDFQYRTFI